MNHLFQDTLARLEAMESEVLALTVRLDALVVKAKLLPKRRTNGCAGKASYQRERDARSVINHNRREGIRTAYRLRTYRCPDCGMYHLTKKEDLV